MTPSDEVEEIGDVILAALKENVVIETADWAVDRVARVSERLHAARGLDNRFEIVVPWIDEFTAFTAPGRHIFVSRKMFQVCDSDDMLAMIVAHEMAHHDLGHIRVFPDWLRQATHVDIKFLILALYRVVEMRIYLTEQECEADIHGLELCLTAGYDGEDCVRLFNVLEKISLDIGDVVGAYGPDDAPDPDDESWTAQIRRWLQQRKRGHLPVRERRELLLRHLRSSTD